MLADALSKETTDIAQSLKLYRLVDPRPVPPSVVGRWLRGIGKSIGSVVSIMLYSYDVVDAKDEKVALKIVDLGKRCDSSVLDPNGNMVVRAEPMRDKPAREVFPFQPWSWIDSRSDFWQAYSLKDKAGDMVGVYKGHLPRRILRASPDVYLRFKSRDYILRHSAAWGKPGQRCSILSGNREIGFVLPWNRIPEIHLSDQHHLTAAVCLFLAQKKYNFMEDAGCV